MRFRRRFSRGGFRGRRRSFRSRPRRRRGGNRYMTIGYRM